MKTPTDANVHMTTSNRFSLNKKTVEEVNASDRIIPTPYQILINKDAQTFDIFGISWANIELLGHLRTGATDLLTKLGVNWNGDHQVTFVLGLLPTTISGSESYTLEITSEGSTITGTGAVGLFHGFMSFLGLLDITTNDGKMTLKEMFIYDKPRFEYRGHQVDVARNFLSKEALKKTIDAMALWKVSKLMYAIFTICPQRLTQTCTNASSTPYCDVAQQLNVLHLALTNDEGWRLEIPGLEELTSVGSKRCFGECNNLSLTTD